MKIFLSILLLTISIPEYAQSVQKAELISAKSNFVRVNTLTLKPKKKENPIEYFGANKDSIVLGDRATLKWSIKSEGNVRIEVSENQQDYTLLSSSSSKEGTLIVTPTKTSFYRIIANESTKMFTLKVVEKVLPIIKVEEKVIVKKAISKPEAIITNESTKISTLNIAEKILPIIKVEEKDSIVVDSSKKEAIIEFFRANKISIKSGEKVKLEWLVKNVPRVSLEFGDSVEKAVQYKDYLSDDFEIVTPPKTTVYVLRSGDVIKTVKIEVAPK